MLQSKKAYYSIREVCERTGLEPHVLRYWETEFVILRPKKNSAGNRAYREKDIDIIFMIKRLLYEEKYTIPGAKKKLLSSNDFETESSEPPPSSELAHSSHNQQIINELNEILLLLKQDTNPAKPDEEPFCD